MTLFKTLVFAIIIGSSFATYSQEAEVSQDERIDKRSYYQKRALEDAKYEQQFTADSKADDEIFWEDQKTYEKNLKRNDKKAYRAYMKGKKDAYASHYEHCDNHCHHSDHYYHHASFYYYGYSNNYYNNRYNNRSTVNTRVRVSTPSVRAGLGLF